MTLKEKAARPGQGFEAAQKKDLPNHNIDYLRGWFDLASATKESRLKRRKKRGWKRQGGHINPWLIAIVAGLLQTVCAVCLFIAGVLQ